MKIEVKNIDGVWNAFMPDGVLRSAGVGEIADMVHDAWPPLEPGREIRWEAHPTKFVVRDVESASKKMSKTERG